MMLAHNLSYDIRFIMNHSGCEGILQKGSKTLTANMFRMHRCEKIPIMMKDTLCMVNMPLSG